MENENAFLLDKIYQTTKMRLEATQLLIPRVQDNPLRQQIENQKAGYLGIAARAKEMLRNDGEMPKPEDTIKKAMLRGTIRANTMINNEPPHIAKLMIRGTAMGIENMTKTLNQLDGADVQSKKLAEDYIANEQKNIDELKKHLWHA